MYKSEIAWASFGVDFSVYIYMDLYYPAQTEILIILDFGPVAFVPIPINNYLSLFKL